MTETDQNGKVAQQWPELATPRLDAAAKSVRVDPKQKALLEAVASVVREGVKDLYGGRDDPKYVYIVDMLMARVRAALKKQGEADGETAEKLAAEVEELKTAAEKLPQSFKDTVGEALAKAELAAGSSDSGTAEQAMREYAESVIAALKADGETRKKEADGRVRALKEKLDLKFAESGRDKAKDLKVRTAAGAVIAKQMAKLASNQFSFKRSLTSGFKSAHKLVTSKVGALNSVISDAVVSRLKSIGNQLTMMTFGKLFSGIGGLLQTVVMAPFKLAFAAVGMIWEGTKKLISWVGGGIWAGLKKFFTTPVGLFAIGYIAGYVWTRWLKPFWDKHVVPIWDFIKKWFGGETSFSEMISSTFKSLLFGEDMYKKNEKGEFEYKKDSNGNVLKDKDGNAIKIERELGDLLNEKILGPMTKFWDNTVNPRLKSLFFKDIYKTDKNGKKQEKSWTELIGGIEIGTVPLNNMGIIGKVAGKFWSGKITIAGALMGIIAALGAIAAATIFHKGMDLARDVADLAKFFKGSNIPKGLELPKGTKGPKVPKGVGNLVHAGAGLAAGLAVDYGFEKFHEGLAGKEDAFGNKIEASGLGYDIADTIGDVAMAFGPAGAAIGATIKAGTEITRQLDELNQVVDGLDRYADQSITTQKEAWDRVSKIDPVNFNLLESRLKEIEKVQKNVGEYQKEFDEMSWVFDPFEKRTAKFNLESEKERVEGLLKTTGYKDIDSLRKAVAEMKKPALSQGNTLEQLESIVEEQTKRSIEREEDRDSKLLDSMSEEYRNGNIAIMDMLTQIRDMKARPGQSVYVDSRPSINPAMVDSYRPIIRVNLEGR